MGGNALQGMRHTRRYAADEYHRLIPEVLARVHQVVGKNNRAAVIPAYRTKESFGDMDVLVELTEGSAYEFRHALARAFDIDCLASDGTDVNQLDAPEDAEVAVRTAAQLAASGKTYSFAHRELQVDILPTSPEAFQPSLNYYSWNDCGNLLGRVAHSFGFKLGHLGLLYPFKSGDYEFTELVVERDWERILPAFGWDYATWSQGFDTLEDMFRFMVSTPFFNRDIYLLHNRNAKSRVRDRKRTTYSGFLEWLAQQPDGSLPAYDYEGTKDRFLPIMFSRLEDSKFREKWERASRAFNDWQVARFRFNGDLVRGLTGVDGKALAGLMADVRASMGASPAEIQAWVLGHSDEDIKSLVLEHQRRRAQQT